jgi:DNA repair protein RadC
MRYNKSKGIVSWPEEERPRERLLSKGAQSLSDAELLAILLRVGLKGKSAIELGRDLLKHFGSIQGMGSAPLLRWKGIKGLGKAKIAQLQAAIELGRRSALSVPRNSTILKSTKNAAEYFIACLGSLPEEHFRVAYLSRSGRLLQDSLIAVGTVNATRPHIRKIMEIALSTNASAIIAAHNHPSGEAMHSESDVIITKGLMTACKPFDIIFLDHIIVGNDAYYSFADKGDLDEIRLELFDI